MEEPREAAVALGRHAESILEDSLQRPLGEPELSTEFPHPHVPLAFPHLAHETFDIPTLMAC